MRKRRNPSLHFRKNKRYFRHYGLFDMERDWIRPCYFCTHYRYEDGSVMDGDYSPSWCVKKDKPLDEVKTAKRPKCFRRKRKVKLKN